jgi:hypothetical protein
MTTISARVVLQSANSETGDAINTVLLRYPRFIHAELMTHRAFSRNAASSRAIPVQKMIDEAINDPAEPLYWFKNQRGMQGFTPMNKHEEEDARQIWHLSRLRAITFAKNMADVGAHKQIVNRLLEPYIHITTLVTATEWSNFFELRDHRDAEPHFRQLAEVIKEELHISPMQSLDPGQWHLPFIECPMAIQPDPLDVKMSVACCASTSYKTVDGFDMTREKAETIYDKLMSKPLHASPLEHVAQADQMYNGGYLKPTGARNFRGWVQLRSMVENGEISL